MFIFHTEPLTYYYIDTALGYHNRYCKPASDNIILLRNDVAATVHSWPADARLSKLVIEYLHACIATFFLVIQPVLSHYWTKALLLQVLLLPFNLNTVDSISNMGHFETFDMLSESRCQLLATKGQEICYSNQCNVCIIILHLRRQIFLPILLI